MPFLNSFFSFPPPQPLDIYNYYNGNIIFHNKTIKNNSSFYEKCYIFVACSKYVSQK